MAPLCPDEIATANDVDRAVDIEPDRRPLMVAGVPRQLLPTHWRLLVLFYRSRGAVVYSDRAHNELIAGSAGRRDRANISRLGRTLEGSRYAIGTRLGGTGYDLAVAYSP